MRLSYKKVRFVSNAMCVGTTTLLVSVALITGINNLDAARAASIVELVSP